MRHSRWVFGGAVLAVALGALALRLPRLDLRPMHGDEGNQAVKTAVLLETGVYRYDPRDHHGPTLYYLSLPTLWAAGVSRAADITDGMLRLMPAILGVGVVLLLLGVGDGLGRPAAVCAGVLTAISPAMVFFSRYYVQETLLVFFTFGAMVAAWRYVRGRRVAWLLAAGGCLGLMHATKETWVIAAAAMLAALVLALAWKRWGDGQPVALRPWLSGGRLAAAAAVAIAVSVTFFSSFFTCARGPIDSVLTYVYYLTRAGGEGLHNHPWHYYLAMLINSRFVTGSTSGPWWTEGLILCLAVIGIFAALLRRGLGGASVPLARFLAFYTMAMAALYAAIPYKTPWCVLGFLHGCILLAGVGAVALVRWVPTRPLKAVACVALAALAAHLGWQAYRASFRFAADQRNPYVYAHTLSDALNIVRRVEEVASVSPDGHDMMIKVITPENYWPLPWYLRRFNQDHVGYYHEVPVDADAAVILTTPDVQEALDRRLKGTYNKQSLHALRPGVFVPIYVEESLWARLVETWSARPGPAAKGGTP